MQPLGLSTTQPLIGNQASIKNASTNITGTSPSLLGTSTPDTAMLFGTMLGLLGNTQASGNQVLIDPVSGFTYNPNPTATNPFLTPAASPNINLAELFNSLPTQFWNALLSLLMNPQASSQAVPLSADPTSNTAAIIDPAAQIPAPPTGTAAKTNTGKPAKTQPKTDKKDEEQDTKQDEVKGDPKKEVKTTVETEKNGEKTKTETVQTILKGNPATGQVAQIAITESTNGKVTNQTVRTQREIST